MIGANNARRGLMRDDFTTSEFSYDSVCPQNIPARHCSAGQVYHQGLASTLTLLMNFTTWMSCPRSS